MEKTDIYKIREAIQAVREVKNEVAASTESVLEEEKNKGPRGIWFVDGKYRQVPYEFSFDQLLEHKTFTELTESKEKQLGRKVNIVDIMGPGNFLNNMDSVNHLFAITLTDPDNPKSNKAQRKEGEKKTLIFNDVYSKETKKQLAEEIDTLGLSEQGIDIMVIRPFAGWHDRKLGMSNLEVETYWSYYYKQLSDYYKLLSKEEGNFFIHLPSSLEPEAHSDKESIDINNKIQRLKTVLEKTISMYIFKKQKLNFMNTK